MSKPVPAIRSVKARALVVPLTRPVKNAFGGGLRLALGVAGGRLTGAGAPTAVWCAGLAAAPVAGAAGPDRPDAVGEDRDHNADQPERQQLQRRVTL